MITDQTSYKFNRSQNNRRITRETERHACPWAYRLPSLSVTCTPPDNPITEQFKRSDEDFLAHKRSWRRSQRLTETGKTGPDPAAGLWPGPIGPTEGRERSQRTIHRWFERWRGGEAIDWSHQLCLPTKTVPHISTSPGCD